MDHVVRENRALLIMDVQQVVVGMLKEDTKGYLERLQRTLAIARGAHIPVIYVVIGFRPGFPEVSPNNKAFAALKSNSRMFDVPEAVAIHTAVAPEAQDIVVTKKRVSAFAGSDLELVLRSMGVNHIILTGIATSGVVLSTLREAADKDFAITVIEDCCADADPEVHRVLTSKVFVRQSQVTTLNDWAATF